MSRGAVEGLTTDDLMQLAVGLSGLDGVSPDSAVYVPGKNIRRILFGIDVGVPELLVAKQLGCDAAVSHHPEGGQALLNFHNMLWRHADFLKEAGVPPDAADAAARRLSEAAEVQNHARNLDHAPSFARLLGMPYLNIHGPLDEIGRRRMVRALEENLARPARQGDAGVGAGEGPTVGDVVNALYTLPELASAPTRIAIRLGSAKKQAGRVLVAHAAGTNGGFEVAKAAFDHGVGTVAYIHVSPAILERLAGLYGGGRGNLVVTGHIASDLLGINPYIEALEKRGIEVIRASGL